jgi:MerR family transcriptional regulator/heat shock protein HspR
MTRARRGPGKAEAHHAGEPGTARYTISVAAELAGVHPQTLRDYEKKNLLDPQRTSGKTRLYSDDDLARVHHIQELVDRGVNLSGVKEIVDLEGDIDNLQARYDRLAEKRRRQLP